MGFSLSVLGSRRLDMGSSGITFLSVTGLSFGSRKLVWEFGVSRSWGDFGYCDRFPFQFKVSFRRFLFFFYKKTSEKNTIKVYRE